MKRIIAFILTVVMVSHLIPQINIYGASTPIELTRRKYGIKFGTLEPTADRNLNEDKELNLDEDEVSLEWEIEDNENTIDTEVYTLEYYVEEQNKTKRIELALVIDQDKDGHANESYNALEIKVDGILQDKIDFNLAQGTLPKTREYIGKISNTSNLKIHIKDTKVQLEVSGIEKGYMTPFRLNRTNGESDEVCVLTGLETFYLDPTHLVINEDGEIEDLGKKEVDGIHYINYPEVVPGSKPGVKIQFNIPKVLSTSGSFEVPTTDQGEVIRIKLDRVKNIDWQESEVLSFYLNQEMTIYKGEEPGGTNEAIGKAQVVGDKITLYLTQDPLVPTQEQENANPNIQNEVDAIISWPELMGDELKAGERLKIELAFLEGVFKDLYKEKAKNKILETRGYTYIRYHIERIDGSRIIITVDTPYDYIGDVKYGLYAVDLADNIEDEPSVEVTYNYEKQEGQNIVLPAQIGEKKYIIKVHGIGDGEIKSQYVKYHSDEDTMPPAIPVIESIHNIYVVPDESGDESKAPQAIGLDLTWEGMDPTTKEWDKIVGEDGKLYYEIHLHEKVTSEIGEEKTSQIIQIVEVSKDSNGQITTRLYTPNSSETQILNPEEGIYTIENIILKEKSLDGIDRGWQFLEPKKVDYLEEKRYPIAADFEKRYDPYKRVPDTYYLTVRAVLDVAAEPDYDKRLAIKESDYKSFSLNNVGEIIPVIDVDKNEIYLGDGKIHFNPVDITSYKENMLDPVGLTLYNNQDVYYEMYLYQDPDVTEEDLLSPTEMIKGEVENQAVITVPESMKGDLNDGILKMVLKGDGRELDLSQLDAYELIFEGLEPNKPYYMQVRTKLKITEQSEKPRYSLFSKVYSFTTDTEIMPPLPEDQIPQAPSIQIYKSPQEHENIGVTLRWIPPMLEEEQSKNTYYEFIRTTEVPLEGNLLKRETSLKDLLEEDKAYKGFKTRAENEIVPPGIPDSEKDVYNEYIYEYTKEGIEKVLEPKQYSSTQLLEDTTLNPNTIYYYYARTVEMIQGQRIASDWVGVPVTTLPITAPTQLQVEGHLIDDPKRETVVSFYAALPKDAEIGQHKAYQFEIAIKGEEDEDFIIITKDKSDVYSCQELTDRRVGIDSYKTQYFYEIKGLEPGKRYDIKVRVKDNQYPDAPSLYSNKVVIRTDFDDEEAEKDEIYDEYLEKYEKEAEKLKRKPYWKVEAGKYRSVYQYRYNYIESELSGDSIYELVIPSHSSQVYYYLPAKLLSEMIRHETTLKVVLNETIVYIRPETLKAKHPDLIRAIEKVDEGEIEDYCIGFEILEYSQYQSIYGEKPVSPKITLNMEMVYLEEEAWRIDEEILEILIELIDDGREDVIDGIEREIQGRTIEESVLDRIIENVIEEIVLEHEKEVEDVLDDVIDDDYWISEIHKPLLLIQNLKNHSVNGYYSEYGWQKQYLFKVSEGYGIEAASLGTYIFTEKSGGSEISMPGGIDLISQYQLLDLFRMEEPYLNWYVTKNQVYHTLARVLGASKDADPITYLKQRGLKGIHSMNKDEAIRQDELIYSVMQAYEKVHYKSVDQIVIYNKQSVSNIGTFQPYYRQYIYSAVQLGFVKPIGQKVSPSAGTTCKDFLAMLSKIAPK